MKTQNITLILSLVFLLVTNNFTVLSNDDGNNATKKILKKINTHIDYPANSETYDGFAIVEYKFNNQGKVFINAINTSNSSLQKHIEEKVENIPNLHIASNNNESIICKYNFVSDKKLKTNKKSGMQSIIYTKDYLANR